MRYCRILTIQDISCVGQCSMTVAMPVLSACGHETCILPTALLSTHTGGFGKPEVCHLSRSMAAFRDHWQKNGITFDAILTGYLGSVEAIREAAAIMDTLLAPGGKIIVDPAMADHGRLYSGLSEEYAREMIKLCLRADVMLPNLTEAAMMAGTVLPENPEESEIRALLKSLDGRNVVLTAKSAAASMEPVTSSPPASPAHGWRGRLWRRRWPLQGTLPAAASKIPSPNLPIGMV